MEPDGAADLASAPPLPDGPPSRGYPRRGGGRGGGPRRGPPPSLRQSRWISLRRLVVTIGDDVCLVPTQIISLSQVVADAVVAEREERQEKETATQQLPKQEETDITEEQMNGGPTAPEGDAKDGVQTPQRGRERPEEPADLEGKLLQLIVNCAARLPVKTGIYAALVGLLYRKVRLRGFVSGIVSASVSRLEETLREGRFTEAKLLLRFHLGLASSHVLALGPVIAVIKTLLQVANELPQATAEHAAHTAMSALPWLSVKLYETQHSSLVDVLDCPNTKPDRETALLLSIAQPFTGAVASSNTQGGPPTAQEGSDDRADGIAAPALSPTDRLASLLDAIDSMIDAEWRSRSTLRFYQSNELLPLLSAGDSGAPPLLDLPPLAVGAPQLRELKVSPLDAVLRLPATLEQVDVPLQPHDQWILEDHILTTLRHFISNISLCAEQLLRIPVDHPQFEYVLVECVFSEMLRLPRSPHIRGAPEAPFTYTRLLQRLCQLQNSLGSVVEVLLSSLVRRAIDMDHETLLTLSDFFGYWLNAWGGPSKLLEEWLGVARPAGPTKLFVKLSLEKAMRLNYPDALALAIPECARELRPPRAVADNPYLCLTPAPAGPPSLGGPPENAEGPGTGAPNAAAGGAPRGLLEFSLLRQMLRFSFEREETKRTNILQVYRLLVFLRGRHKSKGPLTREKTDKPRGDAGHEGGMETDAPETETPAAAAAEAAAETNCSRSSPTSAAEEAAAEAEEAEAGVETPERQQQIDLSPLETCETDKESPPWDIEETVKLFVFCLFALGSKTQTHTYRLLVNYAAVFSFIEKQINVNEALLANPTSDLGSLEGDLQVDIHPAILQAIQKYWAKSQQKMALSLHAFLKVGILRRDKVMRLLCAANPETRDSWAHLELIQTVLRGAIDNCETAREESAAAGAPLPAATEIEELLHCYLARLLHDLVTEETAARARFLFLRCIFVGRKYAEYIQLTRLRQEVETGDPRVENLLAIIEQVRRQFFFLKEESGL